MPQANGTREFNGSGWASAPGFLCILLGDRGRARHHRRGHGDRRAGEIDVELDGKVDSGPNKGLRNTFELVPDAPVSKFILELKGGRKGLLVNSESLCARQARRREAIIRFVGQNGKVEMLKKGVTASCGKKAHPRGVTHRDGKHRH